MKREVNQEQMTCLLGALSVGLGGIFAVEVFQNVTESIGEGFERKGKPGKGKGPFNIPSVFGYPLNKILPPLTSRDVGDYLMGQKESFEDKKRGVGEVLYDFVPRVLGFNPFTGEQKRGGLF